MPLTKQRKLLIAVAGVACLAWGGDRLLLGGVASGPRPASASVGGAVARATPLDGAADAAVRDAIAAATAAQRAALADATDAAARPSLAQRLEAARAGLARQTPDAFKPRGAFQPAAPEPTVAPMTAQEFDPRGFSQRQRLDAVFTSDGEARAVVAGGLVRVGDTVEGMQLVAIGDRWVDWIGHGYKVRVHLRADR